jgi:hypothetical protein
MPVLLLIVRAAGVALAATWLVKEWRRVNAELDSVRAGKAAGDEAVTRLVNDPTTGQYRPERRG